MKILGHNPHISIMFPGSLIRVHIYLSYKMHTLGIIPLRFAASFSSMNEATCMFVVDVTSSCMNNQYLFIYFVRIFGILNLYAFYM